jgi:hypothetical protein
MLSTNARMTSRSSSRCRVLNSVARMPAQSSTRLSRNAWVAARPACGTRTPAARPGSVTLLVTDACGTPVPDVRGWPGPRVERRAGRKGPPHRGVLLESAVSRLADRWAAARARRIHERGTTPAESRAGGPRVTISRVGRRRRRGSRSRSGTVARRPGTCVAAGGGLQRFDSVVEPGRRPQQSEVAHESSEAHTGRVSAGHAISVRGWRGGGNS